MMTCRRTVLIVLAGFCAALSGGCTVAGSHVDVDVSQHFASASAGVDRVGIAEFSFARPQKEQVGATSISRPANAGQIVADAAADLALKLGYDVIDRKQLGILLQEKDLSSADLLKPKTAAPIGKALGIQAVVLGTVNDLNTWNSGVAWGNVASFSARMVRLDTGQVLWSVRCERSGQESQAVILDAIVDELARKLAAANAKHKPK